MILLHVPTKCERFGCPSLVLVLMIIQDLIYAKSCQQYLWPVFQSLRRLLDGQQS